LVSNNECNTYVYFCEAFRAHRRRRQTTNVVSLLQPRDMPDSRRSIFSLHHLIAFAAGSWSTWRSLTVIEAEGIFDHAALLELSGRFSSPQ